MIITLASFIPQLLVAPFSGVWADRYERRWLIVLADGGIALVTLALAILFLLGYNHVWFIYIAAIIRSFGGGVQGPAINALIPQITPKKELVRVNGIYSTINNVLLLLSPVLGGALLTLFPLWVVFMVDVGTAAIAILIMFFLPIPNQKTGKVVTALGTEPKLRPGDTWGFPEFAGESVLATEPAVAAIGDLESAAVASVYAGDDLASASAASTRVGEDVETATAASTYEGTETTLSSQEVDEPESGIKQFRKGFAYVKKHRAIRNLMMTYAFFMVLLAPVAILTPLFIRRNFGDEPWRIAATQTALFAGMAIGGLIVSIRGRFRSHLRVVRGSGFLVAAFTLALAILGMTSSPLFAFFVVLAFLLGVIVPFYTTAVTTLFQQNVEREYHGRVFALLYMIGSAAIPLGTILFGPMADLFNIAHVLLATSVAQLLLLLTTFKTVPISFESGALILDLPSKETNGENTEDAE